MLKKTITYTNFDGVEQTEEFCFNLTKAELVDLDFEYESFGGTREYLKGLIKDIQARGDAAPKKPMYEFIKKLVKMSVGKKSPDGRRFVKSEDIANDFLQTEAYVEFIMDLLSNPDGIPEFVQAIVPQVSPEDRAAAKEELRKEGIDVPDTI